MSRSAGDVVVIGGGVVGAACAYYLLRGGWNVTIIDRGKFGQACSHGNCGFVCPSHVLPLAEPGAVFRTLKAMFRKNSPFYIKPRVDPQLLRWLWKFARRCNTRDMLNAGRYRKEMLISSLSLYEELLAEEAIQCEWEARGLLFVYLDSAEFEAYARTDELLEREFGMAARRYERDQLLTLEPALKPEVVGGWHHEIDCHLRPDLLMEGWRKVLLARGAEIRDECELLDFVKSSGRVTAISTSAGELSADAFVVATGAMTALLNRQLGVRIPIQPGKGYSLTMPRPASCPKIPMIFPQHKVAVTPMQSAYRLGSTMEFAGFDDSIRERRINLLVAGAKPYLNEPTADPVLERWFGWRPMTYDGLPIIGALPRMPNVVVAAGHSMLGLSMAPATGKLVAELLNGDPPHIDPRPFAVRT